VEAHSNVPELLLDILYDPQTSGGLLISLPPGEAEKLVATLIKEGHVHSCIVGEVVKEPPGRIQIL
jgi:selenide,water dikinase